MGFLGDIGKSVGGFIGGQTGFGGEGTNAAHIDTTGFEQAYSDALNGIKNANQQTQPYFNALNAAGASGVNNLANNAEGMKQQAAANQSRAFGADQMQRVRAGGGTGNMAQLMAGGGGMYDSQANAQGNAINQINAMVPSMLGQYAGVQNSLFGQNLNQANSAAHQTDISNQALMGADQWNAENDYNNRNYQNQKQGSFVGGALSALGFSKGGKVPLRDHAAKVLEARTGGKVPGQAPLPGDHPENDIVPAKLSPGEIVVPNSITGSRNAPAKAARFVEKQLQDGPSLKRHANQELAKRSGQPVHDFDGLDSTGAGEVEGGAMPSEDVSSENLGAAEQQDDYGDIPMKGEDTSKSSPWYAKALSALKGGVGGGGGDQGVKTGKPSGMFNQQASIKPPSVAPITAGGSVAPMPMYNTNPMQRYYSHGGRVAELAKKRLAGRG